MVRRSVERASLWKVMMMLVAGRSESYVRAAHLWREGGFSHLSPHVGVNTHTQTHTHTHTAVVNSSAHCCHWTFWRHRCCCSDMEISGCQATAAESSDPLMDRELQNKVRRRGDKNIIHQGCSFGTFVSLICDREECLYFPSRVSEP